ncbi:MULTISPECIES: hypothetical protein [Streptomyces]|uniref:Uncharacterized protein n=2 Tax=Streptomyces TaxID=1883 RepID=A0ABV9J594_9ACTN
MAVEVALGLAEVRVALRELPARLTTLHVVLVDQMAGLTERATVVATGGDAVPLLQDLHHRVADVEVREPLLFTAPRDA